MHVEQNAFEGMIATARAGVNNCFVFALVGEHVFVGQNAMNDARLCKELDFHS